MDRRRRPEQRLVPDLLALGGLDGRVVVSGSRLAVLTPGGNLYAKDGLDGTWYLEAGAVTSV